MAETSTSFSIDSSSNALFGRLIQQINRKLGAGLAYEQILDFIFESLNLLIPFDRIGIALLDEEQKIIRQVWMKSKIPVGTLPKNYAGPLSESIEKIIESGQLRIIDNLTDYLAAHPESQATQLILKDGIRSSLTCPLRVRNKCVGVVFFSSREPYKYKCDHIETFLAIADELSVLIEQARLQQYFEQRQSNEKSFSHILHDLRSPLGVIQGFLEMAQQDDWFESLPDEAKDIFSVLNRNAKNMYALLDELTELKEAKSSKSAIKKQKVEMSEFIFDVVKSAQTSTRRKDLTFESSIGPGLPATATFDDLKIRRVLDNLITNAVKFSRRGDHVILTMSLTDGRLTFSISDTGLGIREHEIPRLFSEFGKTSTRPTEGENSTGLGLAIAKEIVQRHGGELSVKSQFGEGSTFSFWIPLT